VEQLLESGRVELAYLGVQPIQVTPDLAARFDLSMDEGVAVAVVEGNSAAARAGMDEGDVIVSFEGEPIRTVEDLFAQLRQRSPGEDVTVTVVREGSERDLDVTLGERQGE
jgi:S1-C subfamily serine protease